MGSRWVDWPPEVLASLRTGIVIPAHPLALDRERKLALRLRGKMIRRLSRLFRLFCALLLRLLRDSCEPALGVGLLVFHNQYDATER